MRVQAVLAGSLLTNAVLAGLLAWSSTRSTEPAPGRRTGPVTQVITNKVTRNVPIVRQERFSWSKVESEDYPTYIDNLRAIGCPETTIRDIVVADVNQLYTRKRVSEVKHTDHEWWRSEPDMDVIMAAADKLKALEVERRTLLTQLLGANWEAAINTPRNPDGNYLSGPILGDLPYDTKAAIANIEAQAKVRNEAYIEQLKKAGKQADPAEFARYRRDVREQLSKVLTPAQLEEYLLRYSYTANRMRDDMNGFGATPEEFRAIFKLRDATEEEILANYSGTERAQVNRRRDLEKELDASLKAALSPDRFQAYVLNKDPLFREARDMVQEAELPADKVMSVYQVSQLTDTEEQKIRNNQTLSAEERENALAQIQKDKEAALKALLGAEAYGKIHGGK